MQYLSPPPHPPEILLKHPLLPSQVPHQYNSHRCCSNPTVVYIEISFCCCCKMGFCVIWARRRLHTFWELFTFCVYLCFSLRWISTVSWLKIILAINCVVRISPRTLACFFFLLLLIGYFRFVCVVFQLSSHDSDYLLLNIFYTWDSLNLSFCTFKMERVGKSFFFSFAKFCVASV